MTPSIEEATRLLNLARNDYAAFVVLSGRPDMAISPTCFHAQQCVEKALKAVLMARQVYFRKVHDLEELAQLLVDAGITLPFTVEQYGLLNPFAVEMRYDDSIIPLITLEETHRITEATLRWAEEGVAREGV